jgi:predicted RNA-binding Zn ribbon-like protein
MRPQDRRQGRHDADPTSVASGPGDVPDIEHLELVGGRLALDFVNTANWVDGLPVDDRLGAGDALVRWARRAGLLIPPEASQTIQPEQVMEIRLAVRRMFDDDTGEQVSMPVQGLVETLLASSAGVDDASRFVLLAVLFSALELAATGRMDRIRRCPGRRCGWLFLDESPAARRRWCDMATCGNREKVKQHYRRHSSATE